MRESKKNIIKLELDLTNQPDLNDALKAELQALDSKADNLIDYSEVPALDDDWFDLAVKGAEQAAHIKKPISLRLDDDILSFFKDKGKRYQTRINAVLRAYMNAEMKKQHSH